MTRKNKINGRFLECRFSPLILIPFFFQMQQKKITLKREISLVIVKPHFCGKDEDDCAEICTKTFHRDQQMVHIDFFQETFLRNNFFNK